MSDRDLLDEGFNSLRSQLDWKDSFGHGLPMLELTRQHAEELVRYYDLVLAMAAMFEKAADGKA
jgi:hypothetical protein